MDKNLENLIEHYYDFKNRADNLKKAAEEDNKQIKDLMLELNTDEYITENGLQAKITISNRESFREQELLQKLRDLNQYEAIDLIPTINYDKLEDLIYNGKIDAAVLSEFKETKEVVTLKVSKKKGE